MELVGDSETLDAVLGSLVSDHFLVRRDHEQSAPRFVIGNRQIRDYVRKRVPEVLGPEATAAVLQQADVKATEAVAPQILFEVTRVVNSVKPLISGGPSDWQEGVWQLGEARTQFGDQPALLYWLGRFHWRLENRLAAIDFFQRAIAAGSVQADTHARLALVLWREGGYEEGLREATRALALQPEEPNAAQVAGQCLLGAARQAEAVIGRAETLRMLEQARQYLPRELD